MPRVPRCRRRREAALGVLVVVLSAGLSGCGGIGQPAPYGQPGINGLVIPTASPDPGDFVTGIDNPWLPLGEGATWSYTVSAAGRTIGAIEVEVQPGLPDIAGLAATGVLTSSDISGETSEVTRYYAQDEAGNVWLVGEDSDAASWRVGTDGAEAGLAMPADPRLGDGWLTYAVPGLPEASARIEEQSASMVQLEVTGDADEADTSTRNVYEKGVGLAGVENLDAAWTATLTS